MTLRFSVPVLLFAISLPATAAGSPPAYWVTTLAGTSSVGAADGQGSAARFHRPQGVAVDTAGNTYVADSDNSTLRKISPTGTVSTLAGAAGQPGAADGIATAARFNFPASLVCDVVGNLFVADANNHAIRRITPAGDVTTYAGKLGISGDADGPRLTARFHRPEGLALDPSGNLYVADAGNHTIRRISPAGDVTTLAGSSGQPGLVDASGAAARFNMPFRITVGPEGILYIAEAGNYDIRRLTPAGEVSTVYHARYVSLYGSRSYTNAPAGLSVSATGRLFFADTTTDTISELLLPRDESTVIAGAENSWGDTDGPAASACFNGPNALALDGAGNLLIAELGNNTVRRLTPAGVVTTIAGLGYTTARGAVDAAGASARFEESLYLTATSDGTLYVADSVNHSVRKVSPAGIVTTPLGGGEPGNFITPVAAVPDANGAIFVADSGRAEVRRLDAGTVTTIAGLYSMIGRSFFYPVALTRAENGDLFTADYHSSIQRVFRGQYSWSFEDYAGIPWSRGSEDGPGSTARFNFPEAVLAAPSGDLYVADTGNHTIRKIASDRTVSTLAGHAGFSGSDDGLATEALFNTPQGLARDSAGNLFVADHYNHTIRKISPDGNVSTVIGAAGISGQVDGLGADARLYYPQSVAVDSVGNLYIASGSVIRRAQPTAAPAFTQHPSSTAVPAGTSATFTAAATGVPSPTFQWYVDNRAIPSGTSARLTLNSVSAADAGTYTVVATNALGATTSQSATLTVTTAPAPSPAGASGGGAVTLGAALALAALLCAHTLRASRNLLTE